MPPVADDASLMPDAIQKARRRWRFLPASRRGRAGLAVLLALALWCAGYQPWKARYRGQTSAYWAEALVAQWEGKSGPNARKWGSPTGWAWLDGLLKRTLASDPQLEPYDVDAIPVLEELIEYPSLKVRVLAARYLAVHDSEFQRAAPVLIDVVRHIAPQSSVIRAVEGLVNHARYDPQAVRSTVHEAVRPAVLETLDDLLEDDLADTNAAILIEALDHRPGAWAMKKLAFQQWRYRFSNFWHAEHTGPGGASDWRLAGETRFGPWVANFPVSLQAIACTGKSPPSVRNVCVVDLLRLADVKLSVDVDPRGGKVAAGGGLVWRFQDANNYYAAGLDIAGDSVRLYKVINGRPVRIAGRAGLPPPPANGYELRVRHVGGMIDCSLNDAVRLQATDDAIAAAGRIGLWTEADAQTNFDKLRVTNLDR